MLMLEIERVYANHLEKLNLVLSEIRKYRVIPVDTQIQGLCRFLDTRLRGYDGVPCTWAIGPHRWRQNPCLASSRHARQHENPGVVAFPGYPTPRV